MVLDSSQIQEILPHRYPFLYVDRVTWFEKTEDFNGSRIRGERTVSPDEAFFKGHFPDYPIMPGVLIIEALAQVSAILAFLIDPATKGRRVYLTGVEGVKFRHPVEPPSRLTLDSKLVKFRGGKFWWFEVQAEIDDKVVAEGALSAVLG